MFLSLSMLGAALAIAQVPADVAAPPCQSRVTLQVRNESGESAGSVASYLALRDFLGSIAPNLVPADGGTHYAGADRVVVGVATAGAEVLVIRTAGADRADVEKGLQLVVDHLKQIEPGRYRERRDQLARANQAIVAAEAELSLVKARQKDFIAKHGAIDPRQRIDLLQSFIGQRTNEVAQLEVTVAEYGARGDYQRAQLAKIPATMVERERVKNGETQTLSRELQDLEENYAKLLVDKGDSSPEAKAVAAKLDEVRDLLAQRETVARQVPNPRYTSLEADVFSMDMEFARNSTRLGVLSKTLDRFESEAASLTLIAGEYEQIWDAVQVASVNLTNARSELRSAERDARGLADGWFIVVAGPTTEAR